jgi:hypothetical protein
VCPRIDAEAKERLIEFSVKYILEDKGEMLVSYDTTLALP